MQSLEEKQVDGVVLCSSRLDDSELEAALAHHPAAVLVNRRLEGGGVVGSVLIDDEAGGRLATQHLLQAGHRAVGFLAGPLASRSSRQRAKGYRAALAAAALPHHPDWTRHCSPSVQNGRETARHLLTAYPELTAANVRRLCCNRNSSSGPAHRRCLMFDVPCFTSSSPI